MSVLIQMWTINMVTWLAWPGPHSLGAVRAVLILVFAGTCVYTDRRWKDVDNRVVGLVGGAAIVVAALAGWSVFFGSLVGITLAIAVCALLVRREWIGMGDAKFIVVLSALVGMPSALPVFFLCAIGGVIWSLWLACWEVTHTKKMSFGDLVTLRMSLIVPFGAAALVYGYWAFALWATRI